MEYKKILTLSFDDGVTQDIRFIELLDKYGFTETESNLNEWNYVRGWSGDVWIYSVAQEKKLKGSSFIAATMCMSQYEALDNLMFYDARPCGMNSLFSTDFVFERLKGYYPFYMFNQLYGLDRAVEVERESADVCSSVCHIYRLLLPPVAIRTIFFAFIIEPIPIVIA